MEVTPNNQAEPLAFPLPLFKSVRIGEALGKDGSRFFIFAGLDEKMAEELKTLSLDESDTDLQQNTSDQKRFGEGEYKNWYEKNRTPFALIHATTNDLAAIAWFGPKALGQKSEKYLTEKEKTAVKNSPAETAWHTISYRCYPRFRGKGLMKGFVRFVMNLYIKKNPNIKLWAGLDAKNVASGGLAAALGFKPDEQHSDPDKHWLVMVKE
ncbi:MAG TPA: GNAT family N-acetyltransferase [Candidatus Paceibacterota bacterium]